MLTTVLNDSPIFPENEQEQADLSAPLLMDSPQVKFFYYRHSFRDCFIRNDVKSYTIYKGIVREMNIIYLHNTK